MPLRICRLTSQLRFRLTAKRCIWNNLIHLDYGNNRTSDNIFVRLLYDERYTQLTMQSQTHRKIITIAILNLMLIGVEMSESYLKSINLTPETDAILVDLMAIEQSLNVVRNHIEGAKSLLSSAPKEDE